MSELTVFLRHVKRSHSAEVDLSKRELSFVPKELLSIRNIEVLNLASNKIQYLQPSIVQLYKLKHLNLAHNLLTELPEEIMSIPLLASLNLEGNPLKPQFENLLIPQNQKNPHLAEALKACFETEKKEKITDTPHWLLEHDTHQKPKQNNAQNTVWEEKPFKTQAKIRMTSHSRREKGMMKEKQNESKNGVLEIKLNDLVIGEQISMGGFSTIHKGQYHGLEVAVKKVFNPNINEQLLLDFNNEITMLSKYRHPNIVLMVGAVTCPPTLCIVMQYVKMSLYDVLHRRKQQLSQKQKTSIAKEIIQVINFLHKHGIAHRDLKSHNILLGANMQVKLCDFGLARHKSELNIGPMQYTGTPTYMAQELFLKKSYDLSVDIFALGTLLFQLYSGEVPYHGMDSADIRERVLKGSTFPMNFHIKKPILEQINQCRHADPSQRPTIDELIYFEEW